MMGDDSAGEGTSNIRNLKFLIDQAKSEFNKIHVSDDRWPCPFCIIISKTKIKCRIHIKKDHPNLYSANEIQFSQLTQTDSENSSDQSKTENLPEDLNEFLKLVSEEDNSTGEVSQQDSQVEENLKTCIHCPANLSHKTYKGVRGLKIHHNKKHKDIEFSYFEDVDSAENITVESIEKKLGYLNKHVKIIKRIPKGARVAASNELNKLIQNVVQKNDLHSWRNLLFFTYDAFQVPKRKTKSESLTRIVKFNIKNLHFELEDLNIDSRKQKNLALNKRIEAKISDGDIRGATKLLLSSDSLAEQNQETLAILKDKHPEPSRNLDFPLPPNATEKSMITTEEDVHKAIFSFYNGSSGGVDGIRPQHLKDLLSLSFGDSSTNLLKSITALTNLMLSGKVLQNIRRIIYGARLCALTKKYGGIRPIAVGSTFRRITAKIACGGVKEEIGEYLRPKQIGFNTKGGCEAAIHACRSYVSRNRKSCKVILKIDFKNAFNCVERDVLLKVIKERAPSIFAFMWQCYSSPTCLFFGYEKIPSQVGAQQGDPCGPMAFSLCIQPIIEMLMSELNIWYLDDGTLGGEPKTVLNDFKRLITECKKIGLEVNQSKCELFFCRSEDEFVIKQFDAISPGMKILKNDLELLGAPITEEAMERIFIKIHNKMKLMFERLGQLKHHMAYFILKNCFAIPKLAYLLRTSAYFKYEHLFHDMDEDIKNSLQSISNSEFNAQKWSLISLPIKSGGLGIRKASEICLPAFLSSVSSVITLVTSMYSDLSDETMVSDYNCALDKWSSFSVHIPVNKSCQGSWDNIIISENINTLTFDSAKEKARFLASTSHESSAWLTALPSKFIGTLLDNNTFRIAVALRIGTKICKRHKCVCGEYVSEDGSHGLSCIKSAGRLPRHAELNNIIHRSLQSANIPSMREPPGMLRDDKKRVDGVTLVPWRNGQSMVWDATCSDTLAPSYLHLSSKSAGQVAKKAADIKLNKYKKLKEDKYIIIPFAIETLGPWCTDAIQFIDSLGKLIENVTNEKKSKMYLKQRISIALQRSNAASIMGTFEGDLKKLDEIYYIL